MQAVKAAIDDWYASTVAAHEDQVAEQMTQALGYSEDQLSLQRAGSSVIGKSYRLTALDAALVNGYLAHALDYDDVHEDVRGHPSAVLLAALMAEAEASKCSGLALMEGYLIGLEVMCRLGKLVGSKHYELGWHSTATLGGIAAAVAVARMCRYTLEQTCHAIGMATTQAGGLRLHFGTVIKPMHAGFAARNGLLAARLAHANIAGAEETLTGPIGYLSLVSELGQAQEELDCTAWSTSWSILQPGLWFKKYPCCSASYHALDAAHDIWSKHKLQPGYIKAVTLTYPRGGDTALIHRRPKNGLEGKFSAEYVVALKLTQAELSVEDFAEQPIAAELQSIIERTTRLYSEERTASSKAMPKGRFTEVKVELNSGEILTAYCECPTGSPAKPLTTEDRQYKLEQALRHADAKWKEAYNRLASIEELNNLSVLFNQLHITRFI